VTDSIEERFRRLEERLARLEAHLGKGIEYDDLLDHLTARKRQAREAREANSQEARESAAAQPDRDSLVSPATAPARPPPIPVLPLTTAPSPEPPPITAFQNSSLPSETSVPVVPYVTAPPPPTLGQSQGNLEHTIGLKWAGWFGGTVLIIGAALGIKYG
jgi:uncharacterized membrane protein